MSTPENMGSVQIIYDGECPVCSAYVRMLRLQAAAGPVELIDARQPHPAVAALTADGFDLDEGMAVRHGGAVYHGDAAMHWLALMTTPSASFNGLMALLLRDGQRARLLYPVLRAGRNLAVRLMGKSPIGRRGRRGTT